MQLLLGGGGGQKKMGIIILVSTLYTDIQWARYIQNSSAKSEDDRLFWSKFIFDHHLRVESKPDKNNLRYVILHYFFQFIAQHYAFTARTCEVSK